VDGTLEIRIRIKVTIKSRGMLGTVYATVGSHAWQESKNET